MPSSSPSAPLRQAWPLPSRPRPIVFIGAGGIVSSAHLPAYTRLGFPVAGIFDPRTDTAARLAGKFGVATVYASLAEAAQVKDAVFDVAVPAEAVLSVVDQLPPGSAVLIQKPLGRDLTEAKLIVEACRRRELLAAVNFQLRYSPNMLALRDALERGLFGRVTDVEVRINVHTDWAQWSFMRGIPRHEILYHSIHYLDLIRSLLGEPAGVYCRVVRSPELPDNSDVGSSIILDYGDFCRVSLAMNHRHVYGPKHAMSQFKIEGTRGAAVARMGVNLNYPQGEPDTLEMASREVQSFAEVPLRGSWFTHAFEGTMSNLQRVVAGEDDRLLTEVGDAYQTMALVEACYRSSQAGPTPIPAESSALEP